MPAVNVVVVRHVATTPKFNPLGVFNEFVDWFTGGMDISSVGNDVRRDSYHVINTDIIIQIAAAHKSIRILNTIFVGVTLSHFSFFWAHCVLFPPVDISCSDPDR